MNDLSRRKFIGLAALSPVALAVGRVDAQDPIPQPEEPRMGFVGVVAGQRLRVSVFSHNENVVDFSIDVVGPDGKLLGASQGQCSPHTGAFADFDVAAGLKKGQRQEVHVNVTSNQPIGATAEVFDSTTGDGKIVLPPGGDILRLSLGSVGVSLGRALKASVYFPAEPASAASIAEAPGNGRVEFVGLDGKLLAFQEFNITPGTGTLVCWGDGFQNFPALRKGERVQVHVDVLVEQPDMVGATLELFDLKTGETQMPINPCIMPLPPQ